MKKNWVFAGLVFFPILLIAQSTPRTITLAECISLAISNNLDLQIERYNPVLARYRLSAIRGDYDPELQILGEHSDSESGSRLLGGGFSVPGATTQEDSYRGGV